METQTPQSLPGYKFYTVGFLLTLDFNEVALVRKCKPEWQKGLLNGVGGQIEGFESVVQCMEREFWEEALEEEEETIKGWIHFATGDIICHQGPCIVHYLIALSPRITFKQDEKEPVNWYPIMTMNNFGIVPNINWLIEMGRLKLERPEWSEPAVFTTL